MIDIANASQTPGELAVQFPQKGLSDADNQLINFGFGGVG